MKINNMQDVNTALLPYVPLVSQLTGKDTTLARIRPLMAYLGNPQDALKVVHIAGTSGKTSTAYYIAALLGSTDNKIGLTVSPHIDSVKERVQINGKMLTDGSFCSELEKFLGLVEQSKIKPSYFELLYAFSLWEYERQKVDYAVVETGMGGLYDATNVATRRDKICIITDIGFDHMHLLGHTLKEITGQKIGIVHPGNEVFMYRQDDEVIQVVNDWTASHQAKLHLITSGANDNTAKIKNLTMPLFQQRNWRLAKHVYDFIQERDALKTLTETKLLETQLIQVPARMDVRIAGNKTIIMDGAHNVQKMKTFIASFVALYPNVKPVVLLSLKQGKEYKSVLPLLTKFASRIMLTTFQTSQDLPVHSIDPQVLRQAVREINAEIPIDTISDLREAYSAFLATPEPIGVVTGSFYLLSQIRQLRA